MHQHQHPELRDVNGRYRLVDSERAATPAPTPGLEPPASSRRQTQAGFAAAAPAWLGRRLSERGQDR
jgi:hypothetical protein